MKNYLLCIPTVNSLYVKLDPNIITVFIIKYMQVYSLRTHLYAYMLFYSPAVVLLVHFHIIYLCSPSVMIMFLSVILNILLIRILNRLINANNKLV
jgi:hypothetical protein